MDIERPHRTTSAPTTTSELFICFTSRLPKSSSMRLSSKSILSPARAADKSAQPTSLSSSLSRRLRHNGSLRGGAQSPAMFPSKKNRGSSGFAENPEPSSPKVTCIGQVRVKTKKQGKKMKMRACRNKRISGGEASFRRIENTHEGINQGIHNNQTQECGLNHRNQRWVHLPLTICEALRAFGAEFSWLFPCKSSCFSSGFCGGDHQKGEKGEEKESSAQNSCAVFRWLVSLQEGEEGKRRDIELVVGGGGEEGKRRDIELVVGGGEEEGRGIRGERLMMERECSRRRSIFDDMEFDDLFENVKKNGNSGEVNGGNNEEEEEDVEDGRVSVCIPPKNALLLMRCRSDPLKMASLSRKLWDPPLPKDDHDNSEEDEEERVEEDLKVEKEEKTEEICEEREKIDDILEDCVVESNIEDFSDSVGGEVLNQEEETGEKTEEKQSIENRGISEEQECEVTEETQFMEDENLANVSLIEEIAIEEKVEDGENEQDLVIILEENQEMKEEEREIVENNDLSIEMKNSSLRKEEEREREESSDSSTSASSSSSNSSEESTAESKEGENEEEDKNPVEVEEERVQEARKPMGERENSKPPTLPDCLLLMMCEPKLSMEVSKETWVCSTDFIRWLPERHHKKANKTDGSDDSTKKKNKPMAAAAAPVQQVAQPLVQPGRSSISFPAGGGSVANMIDQKLVKAGGYEPFVLTRCKSAPMRSTAKIAAPEMACSLWGRENGRRKLEPHRPATFGVGAAGVGY